MVLTRPGAERLADSPPIRRRDPWQQHDDGLRQKNAREAHGPVVGLAGELRVAVARGRRPLRLGDLYRRLALDRDEEVVCHRP